MKTSGNRGKSPGWAAFTLQQQQKQPFEPEIERDPFPPITTKSTGSLLSRRNHNRKNELLGRSFSSSVLSSNDFPTLPDAKISQKQIHTGVSCKTKDDKSLTEGSNAMALNKLKEVHSWADDALIRDIMGALDNDISKASILLEGMASTGIFEEVKGRQEVCVPSGKHADASALTATQKHHQGQSLNCSTDKCDFFRKHNWDSTAREKLLMGGLKSLPPEPEWEEDEDIYARYRKDAIRMIRYAYSFMILFVILILVFYSALYLWFWWYYILFHR